jgi:hypothetical protein
MKHNLKKITLLFITAMLLGSCEKDEIYEKKQNSNSKPKIKEVKLNELFKKDKKFSNLFEKIALTNQRSSFENQHGFTISDGNVKVIEYNSITSYTMLITRDNVTDDSFFENLVIQEDNNANQKAVLIKYTPTSITNSIDNSFIFEGTIQKSRAIHFSGLNRTNLENTTDSDCYVEYTMCNWGGTEHHAGANCTQTYTKRVKVNCIDEGGSGNGGGGDDDFWSGGSGNDGFDDPHGGGGGSADGDPFASPSQDDENEIEIITSPVPSLDQPKSTPCKELSKMLTNKNTKKSLYDLRNDTNLGHEKGYSVFKNELGIIHALPCVSNNLAPTSIIMPTGKTTSGGNIIGAFHTHPDAGSTSTYPMFSDGDINWLFWVATDNQTPRDKKVYEEFFLTLTVPQGTFAIKIKDWGKFAAFRNNSSIWQSNNIKKGGSLKLLTDTYSSIGHNGSFIQMQNALLELFRDFNAGIGLYEANNDLSGWSELELAPAGASNNDEEPTKKPCQ